MRQAQFADGIILLCARQVRFKGLGVPLRAIQFMPMFTIDLRPHAQCNLIDVMQVHKIQDASKSRTYGCQVCADADNF
jgi:hypothetical protein